MEEKFRILGDYYQEFNLIKHETGHYKKIVMLFPLNWKYYAYESKEYNITIVPEQLENHIELNIIGEPACTLDNLIAFCYELITYNQERGDKEKIYNEIFEELKGIIEEKVDELNSLVKTTPLNKLKNISISGNISFKFKKKQLNDKVQKTEEPTKEEIEVETQQEPQPIEAKEDLDTNFEEKIKQAISEKNNKTKSSKK